MVKIRKANKADAALISDLSIETFSDAFGYTCSKVDMDEFTKKFFCVNVIESELNDENEHYFLAYIEEDAVGYMRLKEDYSEYPKINKYRALELKRIYVKKKVQCLNIGGKLMDHAIDFANKMNYHIIFLGVWEKNLRAKVFYERYGFVDTGDTHFFHIGSNISTDNWFIKILR